MMHLKIDVIFNHTQLKIQYPMRRSSHDTLVKKWVRGASALGIFGLDPSDSEYSAHGNIRPMNYVRSGKVRLGFVKVILFFPNIINIK